MVIERIRRNKPAPGVVRELIGRVALMVTGSWKSLFNIRTVDDTRTDYAFWDKLRRGKSKGYKLGGLFAQPITEIVASYVIGEAPTAKLTATGEDEPEGSPVAYTNDLLTRWFRRFTATLADLYIDLLALGDQFVIVNPDGTLSIPSPETVDIEFSELDPREMVKFTVESKLDKATIKDEYRADGRTVTIKYTDSRPDVVLEFANLIGRIPVVHFANDRGPNERFGRPIYERCLSLFSRYDDLLNKAADGVELMGNPIPTFDGLEDIQKTIEANATAEDPTYTDREGNEQTQKTIRFDQIPAVFVGKGGSFGFKSPAGGFTGDARNVIKVFFLLLLDTMRIPEFVWGGAIASSKASAEAQMPPFTRFVEFRRQKFAGSPADELLATDARGGLLELLSLWLEMRSLIDGQVVVGPIELEWPELMAEDEQLKLEKVKYADSQSLLTDETTLRLLDLVSNPEREAEAARKEADERAQQFDPFPSMLQGEAQAANGQNGNQQPVGAPA
jgi:hypothetical protein